MQLDHLKKKQLTVRLQQLTGVKNLEAATGRPVQRTAIPGVVYLLVDTSGSMSESLTQAKLGAAAFARQAQGRGHAVGLIGFDTEPSHLVGPQTDEAALRPAIHSLIIGGSTNLTAAVQLAMTKLIDPTADRIIYIVTDGMPNEPGTALEVARSAKRRGIKIMTLGTDGADKDYLAQLASGVELALKVERSALQQGISSMARLLTDKGGPA